MPAQPFKPLPLQDVADPPELVELRIVANFVEVLLAREGHANPVGINYLEKIQIPHLASLYGAMLAGVHYVLMGAGIPFRVPGVLDRLAGHEAASYPLSLAGHADDATAVVSFDPRMHLLASLPPLRRPAFLAIVSSHVLAAALLKRANGSIDGFVVEGPTAGGHNAPPRGKMQLNALGEPVYGERDAPDLSKIRGLGLPFWLAGGYAQPDRLAEARAAGAAGVQVGTAFAFCEESGLRPDYKETLLAQVRAGTVRVTTDPLASPTSFPFKVAPLAGTVSEAGRLREARAGLRPRLPARGLSHGVGHRRLPLPGRAGRGVRRQGRGPGRHRRPPVRLQRARGQHRAGPDARPRRRARTGHGGRRSGRPGALPARARHPLHGRGRHRPHPRGGLSRGTSAPVRTSLSLVIYKRDFVSDQTDLIQGTLDLLILRTIALEPMHGWAIAQRIQQISDELLRVQQGSLYPALHRLEHQGWITAEWGASETNRRARFYSLTKAGRKQLATELSKWERLSAGVNLVLART